MPCYLLELYVPKAWSPERAADDARRVEEAAALDGEPLRYVRTLFVAEDETCFHVFEARSREETAETRLGKRDGTLPMSEAEGYVAMFGQRFEPGIAAAGQLDRDGKDGAREIFGAKMRHRSR